MKVQIRQGDVLVEAVDSIPKGSEEIPRDGGRVILAAGEATGHHHAIANKGVRFFRHAGEEDRFLSVSQQHARGGVALRHEEHTAHTIAPGSHRVVQQEEYDQFEIRPVAD